MNPRRIVITGAPASGKTVFFERLKKDRRLGGYAFFDELARQLLNVDPTLRADRGRFHQLIYRQQIEQEAALPPDQPFITDRGTLDAWAFHPELLEELGTTIEAEYARYTDILFLESAAALGPDFYRQDGIRTETIDDVRIIEGATRRIWGEHPGFRQVAASLDLEEKYGRFLELIVELTGRQT